MGGMDRQEFASKQVKGQILISKWAAEVCQKLFHNVVSRPSAPHLLAPDVLADIPPSFCISICASDAHAFRTGCRFSYYLAAQAGYGHVFILLDLIHVGNVWRSE